MEPCIWAIEGSPPIGGGVPEVIRARPGEPSSARRLSTAHRGATCIAGDGYRDAPRRASAPPRLDRDRSHGARDHVQDSGPDRPPSSSEVRVARPDRAAQASAGPPQATALHTLVWHMLGMGYRAVSNIVGKAMNRIARPDGSMSRDSKHISDLYTNVLRKHCARRLSKVGWAGVRLSRPLGSIG